MIVTPMWLLSFFLVAKESKSLCEAQAHVRSGKEGPDQPHLGPLPSAPAQGLYLSSALGHQTPLDCAGGALVSGSSTAAPGYGPS